MVVAVFTRSRKVQQLPEDRRRELGNRIHSTKSIEQLHEIALGALSVSVIFDEEARALIMNDIFDRRYHMLLLSDRFDCDDQSRKYQRPSGAACVVDAAGGAASTQPVYEKAEPSAPVVQDEIECPICLGFAPVDSRTPCNHWFSRVCITDWVSRNDSCPVCRAALRVEDITTTK